MNDAIECFDRIDHIPAILVLTRYGLDYDSTKTLFQVMQKALHTIKTGYGAFEPVYGDKMIPVAGYGQKNGVDSTMWALISSVLIQMYKEVEHGIKIATTITKMILSLMCFAFVHNANLAQAVPDQDTSGEEMIDKFQEYMQIWEGGICASGGAICPNKTKWFLIDYVWKCNKFTYRSIDEIPGNISIPDQDGNMMIINREDLSSKKEFLVSN